MTYRGPFLLALAGTLSAGAAPAADWITAPSYYSHDPQTGQRVTQYTPIGPFYWFARPDYLRSGYRHTRSSLQAGESSDHLHVVEEWGRAVRPYGEWRFPYRPYSVPYALWGPPWAGFGYPAFFPPGPTPPGMEPAEGPYDRQQPPPYYEGSYYSPGSRDPGPHGAGREGPGPGAGRAGGPP